MTVPVATDPPPLAYGYARARLIRGFTDGPDVGREPDPQPASDMKLRLTPLNVERRVTQGGYVTLVTLEAVDCTVDEEGYIVDGLGTRDVTLTTGWWKVEFISTRTKPAPLQVEITEAHTSSAPLDLLASMPPGGPILTPSQYAELDGRVSVLEAGGGGGGAVSSVNGQTGAVVLDAAAVSALPSTYTPPAQSWTQITGKPSTFAPSAHVHAIADVTGLQAALDGKQAAGSYAAAVHTHAIADVTGLQSALDGKAATGHTHPAQVLSIAGSDLSLSGGGGTVTLPSGGGGGGSPYPQVSPPASRIFFPPFTSTGTTNINQNVYLTRLDLPFGSITEIGVEVTTAQAASVLRIGLYAPDAHGSMPSTRLVDAGTIDVSTTGWKTVTLATPIAWTGGPIYGAVYRPSTSTAPAVRSAVGGSQPTPVFLASGAFSGFPTSANTSNGGYYMTGNHDAGLPATLTLANQQFQPTFFGIRIV